MSKIEINQLAFSLIDKDRYTHTGSYIESLEKVAHTHTQVAMVEITGESEKSLT